MFILILLPNYNFAGNWDSNKNLISFISINNFEIIFRLLGKVVVFKIRVFIIKFEKLSLKDYLQDLIF